MKRIVTKQYEQLYANKFINLDEMSIFLKTQTTNAHSRKNTKYSPRAIDNTKLAV